MLSVGVVSEVGLAVEDSVLTDIVTGKDGGLTIFHDESPEVLPLNV